MAKSAWIDWRMDSWMDWRIDGWMDGHNCCSGDGGLGVSRLRFSTWLLQFEVCYCRLRSKVLRIRGMVAGFPAGERRYTRKLAEGAAFFLQKMCEASVFLVRSCFRFVRIFNSFVFSSSRDFDCSCFPSISGFRSVVVFSFNRDFVRSSFRSFVLFVHS